MADAAPDHRRPWPLRVLPLRLRELLVYARYLKRAAAYAALFRDAPLHYAPQVRLDLSPTDVGHALIALAGVFETRLSAQLWRLAREGGMLVDVGANYGYYTCLWAAARPDNRVLAIEASPRNIPALHHNVEKNAFTTRVTVRELAAGRAAGPLHLDPGPPAQTGWGGLAAAQTPGAIEVTGIRLDDLAHAEGIASIATLKIDVEGADAWVLEGAEGLLRNRRIAHVFFEDNPRRMAALGIDGGQAQRFLAARGYRSTKLTSTEWHAEPA